MGAQAAAPGSSEIHIGCPAPHPGLLLTTVLGKLRYLAGEGRAGSGPLISRAESICSVPLGLYHKVKFQQSEGRGERWPGESWQSQVCPGSHSWKGGKTGTADETHLLVSRQVEHGEQACDASHSRQPRGCTMIISEPLHLEGNQINWI